MRTLVNIQNDKYQNIKKSLFEELEDFMGMLNKTFNDIIFIGEDSFEKGMTIERLKWNADIAHPNDDYYYLPDDLIILFKDGTKIISNGFNWCYCSKFMSIDKDYAFKFYNANGYIKSPSYMERRYKLTSNLLDETKDLMERIGKTSADIELFYCFEFDGISTSSHYYCNWKEFKQMADQEYNCQNNRVFLDIEIIFKDCSKFERRISQIDNSECWVYVYNPVEMYEDSMIETLDEHRYKNMKGYINKQVKIESLFTGDSYTAKMYEKHKVTE